MGYLDELNSAQKEAVLKKDGPLLVLAGAGAGKTRTLAARILHLVKEGVAPERILAITFTNKAAKEMRDRVRLALQSDPALNRPVSSGEEPFISTFHALAVKLIRENAELLGLPRHFVIFDRGDSLRAVKEALKEAGGAERFEPGSILSVMSREKGNLVTSKEYANRPDGGYAAELFAAVWERYERILGRERALDFDDLLLRATLLLRDRPEILARYQETWRYFHVDEYQDTNRAQYVMMKLLAGTARNVFAVGDIDQTIYSWRGADIRNLLNFEKDYPDAAVILLEENYRSTETILAVANRAIQKNKLRREKNLFTRRGAGEKIGVMSAYDEADEARFVAGKARELIGRGVPPGEIAVLYRANFQSRALEEAFLAERIPYQVLGTRFFERAEVKDVLAYLRAALNPESLSDLKRAMNVPPRGIGKVSLLKILSGREGELPAPAKKRLAEFRTLLAGIKEAAGREKPSQTVKHILRASGLEAHLKAGGGEGEERLENIRELVTFATRYDVAAGASGLEQFLTDAALASDQDELLRERDAVRLMTVHAAKGLEFETVFITGLEEDLFPHARAGDAGANQNDAEEERRLFYVALTRAKKKLYLSSAGSRTIFGAKKVNLPSEFLLEIDDEFLEKEEPLAAGGKIIYLD